MNRGLSVFVDASAFPPRDEQARGAVARIVGTPSQALYLVGNLHLHKKICTYVWNVHIRLECLYMCGMFIYFIHMCVCVCVCVEFSLHICMKCSSHAVAHIR